MKIRLKADLFIEPTKTVLINQIRDFLVANKGKFLKINGETSSISVEKCRHDESPPQPCEIIFDWKQT